MEIHLGYFQVMKSSPDCVPCLLKRVLFQARLLDNGTDESAVRSAVRIYSDNMDTIINSAKLATKVHAGAYAAMGVEDPYYELKIRADEVASRYMSRLNEYVNSSEDRFAAAVRVSIIGNVMDFGSGISMDDPDEFDSVFESLLEQGIGHDEISKLRKCVDESSTVIYVFDNCGEDLFDTILIKELKSMGKRVVGVVRGEPILNDVTISDAKRIGLDILLDRLLTTNAFAIGVDMCQIGPDLRDEIKNAGIIIAKGMANYESLSDENMVLPVAYLLRAKCRPVANCLGVSIGTNVVHVHDPY